MGAPYDKSDGVAPLANETAIGCVLRLASIPFVFKRIFRFLLR
jgi:hypothetical protein